VEKVVDGTDTTKYIFDGNNVLQETDDAGTVEADYTYVPGQYGRVISQHRDTESSFYHFDGIKNVRKLTDDSEVVSDEYTFDAFGNEVSSSGSTANSQRYKGRLLAYHQDPEAAPQPQYALHHRNYDPSTGVLTSRDPAEDDSNLYRYVKNNPINREDASGLQESAEELINRGLSGLGSIDESDLRAFTKSLSGDHAVYVDDRMISVTTGGKRFVFHKYKNERKGKNVRYGERIPGQEAQWRLAKIVSESVSLNALIQGKEIEDSLVFYEGLSSTLEFSLHAVPGGTLADHVAGGMDDSWGYVALVSAGDGCDLCEALV
jgi:RHS repeat-associated protein